MGSTPSKSEDCCEVTTWTRPIEGGSSSCSGTTLFNIGIDHSIVAFEYTDGVFVCQAGEENGWLKGTWEFIEVDEFKKQYPEKKMNLGCHELTKEFLLKTLERMKIMGYYNVLFSNCHTWVERLVERTGVYFVLRD